MNREQAKKMLPIIQAFANGEKVEYRPFDSADWEAAEKLGFKDEPSRYRIKPKPREMWVTLYPGAGYGNIYTSEHSAKCGSGNGGELIHFREVIE